MMSWKCTNDLDRLAPDSAGQGSAAQFKTAVEMLDGMSAMGVIQGGSHQPQPETSIALAHKHRLRSSLAVGLEQGHTELFRNLMASRFSTQSTQKRIHLSKGHEGGPLGVCNQDQPIQPLHL